MAQGSESSSMTHPTLHHFGLTTVRLDELLDWYAKVLGMTANLQSSSPYQGKGTSGMKGVWVSNDMAHHRIALIALPDLQVDSNKRSHSRLQHVAFEYATINDLLDCYVRLKGLGIKPLVAVDHGVSLAFYYEDPDGNSVELLADAFGDWEKSREFMRNSPQMKVNPMGTFVDPEQMVAARQAGASSAELHQRGYAGEFAPSSSPDPGVLLS